MEPRIIHIEYETEDNRNNLGISMLSLREDDLKTISLSTSCGARVLFTREVVMKALEYWQKTQGFRPKEDPRHDSVYQRLEALEKQSRDFPIKTLSDRQIAYRAENFNTDSKLTAEIDTLKKNVKALEDQHREILPDPEKDPFYDELLHKCKELEGANEARQTTIELLCKTIENIMEKK